MLPCDISVPRRPPQQGRAAAAAATATAGAGDYHRPTPVLRDELTLIMWYREDVKTPIYSIDVKSGE